MLKTMFNKNNKTVSNQKMCKNFENKMSIYNAYTTDNVFIQIQTEERERDFGYKCLLE